MTDRVLVYDGALPQTTDVLNTSKFAMLGDAFLAMATLGNSATAPSTVVAGLACTPTSPASLQVNVGPGAIFSLDTVDATGYGDLGTDSNQVYKMGIREALATLPAITPPGTSGYSQVFLVEAILSDIDAGSTVLSYYDAANPSVPFSGPGNAGTSNNTTRTCVCTIALKAGVAAPTGSQTNPSPDSGYTGLYYITVANGQSTITAGNIVALNAGFAPFVNTALPYIPSGAQAGGWSYGGLTTNTGNAFSANLAPIPTALPAGMRIMLKMSAAPFAGSNTLNINSLGAQSIVRRDGLTILGNEWLANNFVAFVSTGSGWQIEGAIPTLQPLTSNTTFYVNASTGSDSTGNGTSGAPWATLQHAYNIVQQSYNLQGAIVTFNCTGTFSAGVFASLPISGAIGVQSVVFSFASGSSVAVTNASCFTAAFFGCAFTITTSSGLVTLTATGTGSNQGCGVNATVGGQIFFQNIAFSACTLSHINSGLGGTAQATGNYSITGTASGQSHLSAADGLIANVGVTVTGASGLSFGTFANCTSFGFIEGYSVTYSGFSGVAGVRYDAANLGLINTGGGGASYFPGSSAGSTSSGGEYI